MIKLTQLLKEIEISTPGNTAIKVTNLPYKDIDASIIVDFVYKDNEMGGESSHYNDTLQNVVKEIKNNPNKLYSHPYGFRDLYRFIPGILGEIYEDTLTKNDVLTLVDLYNKKDNQRLLEYVKDALETHTYDDLPTDPLTIENNMIIDPNSGEVIALTQINEGIEEVLLPFVTLLDQLKGNYTITYGDYVGEGFLIERYGDVILGVESLYGKEFNGTLSEFTKRGTMVINSKTYQENPEVF